MPTANKNYYKILQVDPSAEPEVIKAAYKRLSLKYHPDSNPSPEAKQRMYEINEAFEVLGDPGKRAQYDSTRLYQTPPVDRQEAASDPGETATGFPFTEEIREHEKAETYIRPEPVRRWTVQDRPQWLRYQEEKSRKEEAIYRAAKERRDQEHQQHVIVGIRNGAFYGGLIGGIIGIAIGLLLGNIALVAVLIALGIIFGGIIGAVARF